MAATPKTSEAGPPRHTSGLPRSTSYRHLTSGATSAWSRLAPCTTSAAPSSCVLGTSEANCCLANASSATSDTPPTTRQHHRPRVRPRLAQDPRHHPAPRHAVSLLRQPRHQRRPHHPEGPRRHRRPQQPRPRMRPLQQQQTGPARTRTTGHTALPHPRHPLRRPPQSAPMVTAHCVFWWHARVTRGESPLLRTSLFHEEPCYRAERRSLVAAQVTHAASPLAVQTPETSEAGCAEREFWWGDQRF